MSEICPGCGRPLGDPDEQSIGQFHRDAGKTEREAALRQFPKSGTARRRVLIAIAQAGDVGRTDEEISHGLAMRLYTAAPRRNELVTGGWVMDSGRARCTTTGSAATVWILTPAARARYDHWREQQ